MISQKQKKKDTKANNNINININFNLKNNKPTLAKKLNSNINPKQQIKPGVFSNDAINQKKIKNIEADYIEPKNKKSSVLLGQDSKNQESIIKTSRKSAIIKNNFTHLVKNKNSKQILNQDLNTIISKNNIKQSLDPTPTKKEKKSTQKLKKRSQDKIKKLKRTKLSYSMENIKRGRNNLIQQKSPTKSSKQKSKKSSLDRKKKKIYKQINPHIIDTENQVVEKQVSQFLPDFEKNSRKLTKKLKKSKESYRKSKNSLTIQPNFITQQEIIDINNYMNAKRKKQQKKPKHIEYLEKKKQSPPKKISQKKNQQDSISTQRYKRSKSAKHSITNNKVSIQVAKRQQILATVPNQVRSEKAMKKKKIKSTLHSKYLLQKYYRNELTVEQAQKLIRSIIKIQKVFRGFSQRLKIRRAIQYYNHNHNNNQIENLVNDTQNKNSSLVTIKIFEQVQHPQQNQQNSQSNIEDMIKIIGEIEKVSKDEKIEKKLKMLVETAIKSAENHRRLIKENKELKQLVLEQSKNKLINSNSNEVVLNKLKYLASPQCKSIQEQQQQIIPISIQSQDDMKSEQNQKLQKFKEQSILTFEKLKQKNFEIEIEENYALYQKSNIKQMRKEYSMFENLVSPKYTQPKNIIQLLDQKKKIINTKYTKQIEVLEKVYDQKIISPKTFKRRLDFIDKNITQETSKVDKSLKQAQQITNLIKEMKKDKEQILNLQKIYKQQRWNDALDIVNNNKQIINNHEMSAEPANDHKQKSELSLSSPSIKIVDEAIDSAKLQRIFSCFQNSQKNQAKKSEDRNISPQRKDELDDIPIYNYKIQSEQSEQNHENSTQRHGFATDINFIKQYCIALCEYINQQHSLNEQFKKKISQPIKFNNQLFLNSYRQTINGQYDRRYNSFNANLIYPYFKLDLSNFYTISPEIAIKFNTQYDVLLQNSKDLSQDIIELQNIHLYAILSVLNQALNYQRPYSKFGLPEPWIIQSKYLKNINIQRQINGDKSQQMLQQIFSNAITKILRWGTTYCGIITQTLKLGNGTGMVSDQQYENQIKQTRMALMLQKMLIEQESQMLQFRQQQTEVYLQLSEKIFSQLIEELQMEIVFIQLIKIAKREKHLI